MNFEKFKRAIKRIIPEASVDFDNKGQVIVKTDKMLKDKNNPNSDLVAFIQPQEVVNE